MRIFHSLAALAFVTVFVTACARAAFAADGNIPMFSVLEIIRPYLLEIAGVLIVGFMGWLSSWLRATFKVSLDEAHRVALHSALDNGARVVLERLDNAVAGHSVAVSNPSIERGIEYVLKYTPEAVAYFGLTPERVGEMLRAKLTSPVS